MKKFNFIYLLLAFVGVLSMTSCEHKYADYAPGSADKNMGVYFPNTAALVVKAEDSSVEIAVSRMNTAGDVTISLRSEDVDECGFFTIPKQVSFADGEANSKIVLTFDGSQLTPGVQYPLLLQIDQAEASAYGISEYTFMVGIAEPWKQLGKGIYRDDFLSPLYGGPSGVMVEVDVVQHELEPHRYRMVEPYSQAMCPYIIGGVPSDMIYTGPGYVEFWVDEAGNVEIPSSPLGFKLVVEKGGTPQDFYLATIYADAETPMYGKFENGVFWFTTPNSIMWHIPDGRGNYANTAGLFALALPGNEITDYSIDAAYGGMVVEADNQTVYAVVNFALGTDVHSYEFTVLEGNVTDIESVIDGIIAGSDELTIYEASADELTWKLSLESSKLYTVVAVPYRAENEPERDDAIAYQFYFPGIGGSELPEPEFKVFYESVASLTGNEEYEAQFPAAYFVALGIVGNADEMKSIKVWIGDSVVADNSGMDYETIVANYGEDYSNHIDTIRKNYDPEKGYGSVVVGPYNMLSGSTSLAIVAIETVYGKTQVYAVKHTLPNATGFALGSYNISETVEGEEYGLGFYLTGGLQAGQLVVEIDGFQFGGVIDEENGVVVFDGVEINDVKDYIANTYNFYYDDAQTMAFGYFAASDATLDTPADLTFSYEGDKIVGLETYFASCVFSLEEGTPFVGYDFYFSPEAVIEYTETPAEETPETPETSAMRASVKSLGAELQFGVEYNAPVDSIKAEVYYGKVNRQFVSNATIGF